MLQDLLRNFLLTLGAVPSTVFETTCWRLPSPLSQSNHREKSRRKAEEKKIIIMRSKGVLVILEQWLATTGLTIALVTK